MSIGVVESDHGLRPTSVNVKNYGVVSADSTVNRRASVAREVEAAMLRPVERISKGVGILWSRLTVQGLRTTAMWAANHIVRITAGAPIRGLSQITPHLHVGGQYRRHGWPTLAARGVTAVVNMRIEFDDYHAGIAPPRYLHLPTVDDEAPTLEYLRAGAAFTAEEIARGGSVYIHCGAGAGRAPAMAAAYLVSTGLAAEEAWARIRAVRPFIRPKPAQVKQVERFAGV
jgi:dual specificity MAP kinase phosphatase